MERPNLRQRAGKTLMLALRRPEGLDFHAWQDRFGLTFNPATKSQTGKTCRKKTYLLGTPEPETHLRRDAAR